MRTRVCILGGGIAGLAAAHRLTKDRVAHVLLEKDAQVGGLLSAISLGQSQVERFYHHIFTHDHHTLGLLHDLRLQEDLVWQKTRMGLFLGNRLFETGNPLKFLFAGPLTLKERILLLRAMKKIAKIPDPSVFDNESAAAFLDRTCGPKLTQEIFLPLLRAKFGMTMDNTSAAFLVGRIAARAKTRKPFALSERLGYIRGGYQRLLNSLSGAITATGGTLETGAKVVSVERVGDSFQILWERQGVVFKIHADALINTLPIPLFLRVVKNSPPRYASDLRAIRYQGVIAVAMALDRSVSPYYWTTVAKDNFPFSTLVEHTRFMPIADYAHQHIVYMSRYLGRSDPYWILDNQRILTGFVEGLSQLFPKARNALVKAWKVSRSEFATPVFEKGFLRKIPQQKTPWEGLFNAGSVHVYPDSRNINNVIASGATAANLSMEYLNQRVVPATTFLTKGAWA